MKKAIIALIVVIVLGLIWFVLTRSNNVSTNNPTITLKTNQGDIVIELFADKTPITASNFLNLAKEGFYDNTKFHGWMECYVFTDEKELAAFIKKEFKNEN